MANSVGKDDADSLRVLVKDKILFVQGELNTPEQRILLRLALN